MSSVNKAIILGNLGRDPEVRTMQSGDKVANLSIATSERWKDRNSGEQREKTEWHRVVIFGRLAEIVERYLKKGSKVYLEGKIQTRKWTDQSGQEKYSTEIVLQGFDAKMVMLDGKGGGEGYNDGNTSGGGYDAPASQEGGADLDDDIPF